MNEKAKVLVIEDDHHIRNLLQLQLEMQGHQVKAYATGTEGISNAVDDEFNLILIDRMLPDISGIEICKKIRTQIKNSTVPIIFITAMSTPENIIEGLDAGADDYITKPFDVSVLNARVRAHLRRLDNPIKLDDTIEINGIMVDPKRREVQVDSTTIALTQSEFDLLAAMAREPGIVQTRENLIQSVFGAGVHVTTRTIDTHMVSLRKKLGEKSQMIETIRGVGYRLNENWTSNQK